MRESHTDTSTLVQRFGSALQLTSHFHAQVRRRALALLAALGALRERIARVPAVRSVTTAPVLAVHLDRG